MAAKTIIFIAGARPNFMKIAPILRALAPVNWLTSQLVHTGQHYDPGLSDVFFEQLAIPAPDVHLNVGSGTHGDQTARVLSAVESHLLRFEGALAGVVVVGDVNSTMAATLAAAKLGIPVAHVEAGLRSFDRSMPEEINRVVTDALAEILFVTEPSGTANLLREGVPQEKIWHVGNVMIDTLVRELSAARQTDILPRLGIDHEPFVAVTLHRPSNVDIEHRLKRLVHFLGQLGTKLPVIFPVHPRTQQRLDEFGLASELAGWKQVQCVGPMPYRENLRLLSSAKLVITDSGGIQEETTYLGIPCLTLRPNTERPVTVSEGTNTIVGDDLPLAMRLVDDIIEGRYKTGRPVKHWDGHAAERIVEILDQTWGR